MYYQELTILLFTLIYFSGFLLAHLEHHCVHDEKYWGSDQPEIKISRFERRMRQTAKLFDTPIRIHLDTSNLLSKGQEREFLIKIMSKIDRSLLIVI